MTLTEKQMSTPALVWLLWHVPPTGDSDDALLIGAYESEESAQAAIGRLCEKPGFRDHPGLVDDADHPGFLIAPHELDKDMWSEGYRIERSEGVAYVLPAWMPRE